MGPGVTVSRIVAAPDLAAAHAQPQVNPGVAHRQTFLAAFRRARLDILNQVEVPAFHAQP